MDDYYSEGDKPSGVINRFQHLRKAMRLSSLEMGKIQSNPPSVLDHFPYKEKASGFREIENKNGVLLTAKALGVRWDCQDDSFCFSTRAAPKPPLHWRMFSVSSPQPLTHGSPSAVLNGGKVAAA